MPLSLLDRETELSTVDKVGADTILTTDASILAPASRTYRGEITDPDRWTAWAPRKGDILVCTPPKCGTTWVQTILTMLVHGGPDLPERTPTLSPWGDADLGIPANDVATALSTQKGRRAVKTHTPADDFPVWQGVIVIAVYRHPLDVFFCCASTPKNKKCTERPPDALANSAFGAMKAKATDYAPVGGGPPLRGSILSRLR